MDIQAWDDVHGAKSQETLQAFLDSRTDSYAILQLKRTDETAQLAYDAFTAKYGLLNSRPNARVFGDDSSYYLLCSLEDVDEDGKLIGKADMFTNVSTSA